MISKNIVRIGTATKWRGVYSDSKVYYYDNIVTISNCIFRCNASHTSGKSPVNIVDEVGHIEYANTDVWGVVLDMSAFTNLNLDYGDMLQKYYDKIKDIESINLYDMLVAAGYGGTEEEMYVGLVGLLLEAYKTNADAPARLEYSSNIDGFLGPGETATVVFEVWRGFLPITPLVTKWTISRDGGDPPSDKVWNASAKAVNFAGSIDLTVDDLSPIQQSTTFTVTAEGSFSEGAVSYNLEF